MKLKAGSLKRTTKSINPQPDSSRKKERTLINKIQNERGKVTVDITEIQRIIRDQYKQLYANKTDNLEEMNRFLQRYNLPRLNQEQIEKTNRPITSTEVETVIKNFQQNSSGLDDFTGRFYQHSEKS